MGPGAVVARDAALLALTALTFACAKDSKAGRRARKQAIREMEAMRVHPGVRSEAIGAIRRSCGACGRCRGP